MLAHDGFVVEGLTPELSADDAASGHERLALTRPEPLVTFCLVTAALDSPKLRVFRPHSVRVMMHVAAAEYGRGRGLATAAAG